jgi:Zn-dependent protease
MIEGAFARPLFRFRALGIPVTVEPTFLVTTFLLAGAERSSPARFGVWLAVVFISVLVHELGHALAGRIYGLEPEIKLYAWGGLTSWMSAADLGRTRRLVISLAGPAVAIALGVACHLARPLVPPGSVLLRRALADFVWASGIWGCVNLLPILPLDGGRALEALLGDKRARAVLLVSAVVGLGAGAYAIQAGHVAAGVVAAWLGLDNLRRLREERLDALDDALYARLGPRLHAALEAEDADAVLREAVPALAEARTDRIRAWLVETIVTAHAIRGSFAEGVAAIAAAPSSRPPDEDVVGFLVSRAVIARRMELAASFGAPAGTWAEGFTLGDDEGDDPWTEAVERLRGPRDAETSAVSFAHTREAAELLGLDADAAALGEALLDRSPDPDLAFAVAAAHARAGDPLRAERCAERAAALGFRDWDRVDAGGAILARVFARVRD